MRLQITTTYSNVDAEWLNWYYERLANEQHLHGSTVIVEELKKTGYAAFVSKDPSSEVTAETEYELIK